ncbi:RNase adapter RapZ [Mobilitalea sibirica]|uniref:RNase adapter RapZ n=1 Tax=Mobilitalea sibirica TaxID=1462919 RepID=A0A8J7L0J7_9FIRM|nr:RNase adapter RapZ [Mobilitalea sibirica]MBH1942558.1 RNase adapter RapZ [Mobilitalea sibirica]
MRFVIVTGMSGAGKSSVLKMLEDAGYFCVDNLPIQLVKKFVKLIFQGNQKKVALGLDIRSGQSLKELDNVLQDMKKSGFTYEILFLDCTPEVLVKRYKETRRNHPLSGIGRVDKGIELEREELDFLRKKADTIIDTSHLLIRELKTQINRIYVEDVKFNNFYVTILSFGFKYGIPVDSDLVFDVRFLPNPYYIPELKKMTGRDPEVKQYVMEADAAKQFLNKLEDMLLFLIPHYIAEGKNQLVVSIGCTGGKHRSVTLVSELKKKLLNTEYGIKSEHRDIEKDE